jgi:hypothetical protein
MKIDFIGLELIVFHDLPLHSLSVEYGEHPKLEIAVAEFDDSTDTYKDKRIVFGALKHIIMNELSSQNFSDYEIYSFDYHLIGDLFFGKMIILQGFGEANIQLEFSCGTVIINT